jgi:hypothetical protein
MSIDRRLKALEKKMNISSFQESEQITGNRCKCERTKPMLKIAPEDYEEREEIINQFRICPDCGKPRNFTTLIFMPDDPEDPDRE